MSAAAPNPDKTIMLIALGIGVYWYLKSRPAVAGTPAGPAVAAPDRALTLANLAAQAVGSVARYLNGGITPGTYDSRSASSWSPAATGANNPSAYSASSAVDGAAYNPPGNVSPYDSAVDMGTATGDDLSAFY